MWQILQVVGATKLAATLEGSDVGFGLSLVHRTDVASHLGPVTQAVSAELGRLDWNCGWKGGLIHSGLVGLGSGHSCCNKLPVSMHQGLRDTCGIQKHIL